MSEESKTSVRLANQYRRDSFFGDINPSTSKGLLKGIKMEIVVGTGHRVSTPMRMPGSRG